MVERTNPQIVADKLDLEMFNLSRSLESFAKAYGDAAVDDASRLVYGLRGRIQRHMHRDDVARLTPSLSPGSNLADANIKSPLHGESAP